MRWIFAWRKVSPPIAKRSATPAAAAAFFKAKLMAQTKTNPLLRVLPSMTDFAFVMPVIFIFAGMKGARTLLGDGDTGWHIRTGEWIMSHGRVPHVDIFSFTKNGQPWFAWEWLWDVIFAWMHQHWGLATVVVASALVISFTSAL